MLTSVDRVISCRCWVRLVGLALVALVALFVVAARARAATLTVTRTDDPAAATCAPGNCSLRAAIAEANTDGGDDTIEIPAGAYQLTGAAGGSVTITASMTLAGAGARATIVTPASGDLLFLVNAGAVAVDDLTLTGSTAAGNGGALEISGSAAVTIERDTLSNNNIGDENGGAISDDSTGQLTIDSSTFTDNKGYNGGALNSVPPTRIVNSTFFGNDGGDSTHNGDGGAMQVANATLINDTITGNECFNGSGCGGGIFGTVSAADTIIADNTDNGGSTADNCAATVTVMGPDLENGTSCTFAAHGGINGIPVLGPLQNNGGPTNTMEPGSGSAAIGAGTNATCATVDQRGGARPSPAAPQCDIGAVEVDSLADTSITGGVTPTTLTPGGGVSYTLTATNSGPDPALNTTVQNLLPAGATFSGAISSVGSCSGSTTLTCSLGTLAPGAAATITVSGSLGQPGTATDTAAVHAPATDPNPGNNEVSIVASVQAPAPPPAVRPVLSHASISPARFGVASRATAISAPTTRTKKRTVPRGATVSFQLNEAATVSIVIQRKVAGHRNGKRCLAGKPREHGTRCTALSKSGTLTRRAAAGHDRVSFTGRIGSRPLPPGNYVATLVAVADGRSSKTVQLKFTIVS
jgi:uncharacterized repeat protein (TIGR01451 family)